MSLLFLFGLFAMQIKNLTLPCYPFASDFKLQTEGDGEEQKFETKS